MAKQTLGTITRRERIKKTTSIGRSKRTRPKNKHAKRSFKKYRGQG